MLETQRMDALARANAVRTERARVKRAIAVGERDITELLADPPEACLGMAIGELLRARRGLGPAKIRMLLRAEEVRIDSPTRPIGRLTGRQRIALASLVR